MRTAPEQPVFNIKMASRYNSFFINNPFITFNNAVVEKKSPYEKYGPKYYATGNDFTKDNLSFKAIHPLPDALVNMLWSKCFLQHKLGVMVSADYQNIKTANNSFYLSQNGDPQINNAPGFTDFFRRTYSSQIIRKGVYGSANYNFNAHNKIQLYQFYINQKDIESRKSVDTNLVQGRSVPGTGRINIYQRSREHFQSIYNASLTGNHGDENNLLLHYTFAYSIAKGFIPGLGRVNGQYCAYSKCRWNRFANTVVSFAFKQNMAA